MSRVLLLNPPGSKNYIRDYFCSKLSKANYISPPVVLLTLSGILAAQHEVSVLDATVERLSAAESLDRIEKERPETIVTLVGAASWEEDEIFLRKIKERLAVYIIAIGDLLLENTGQHLRAAAAIDAALLNFITPDIMTLISGRQGQVIPNAVYWHGGKCVQGGMVKNKGEYRIPRPRHELFPLARYRFPFMIARPMTAMLTDYGCPFACTFCVIPALGFALRPLADLREEMEAVRQAKVKEIFFLDQTFGVRRGRTLELCRLMEQEGFHFHWSCFSRADVLDDEVLEAMARAGCHTIIFGVESGNDATLVQYHKKMDLAGIAATLHACRRAGIRVAATFMLGLPGEDENQTRKTIDLACRLPVDFVSFNVAIPRAATGLRAQAIAAGLIDAGVRTMDQSGIAGAMSTREMSAEKILLLRREALRRFYFRPGYLLRRLFTLRSWTDFASQAADGLGVIRDAVRKRNEGFAGE
ncbi:radical SAM protein [candidate division FCPU426 bacterium]|nr:radical SAM protein [candidate division FCPU426 bacterium]